MKNTCVVLVMMLFGLALAGPVHGQTAMQKMLDALSGKKKTEQAPSAPKRESDARLLEILVELAWLSDPVTFPFFLDARVDGQNMQIRGSVLSRSAHEHALKLAQMNCPLPVVDGLKENLRLNVKPTRMTPEQLEKVVRAALRESVPRQAKNLQTRCTADGQVAVSGNVDSFEQKLTISQVMRRLHGCTVVINRTKVGYDPDGNLARSIARPPAPRTGSPTPLVPLDPVKIEMAKNNAPVEVVPSPVDIKTEPEPISPGKNGSRLSLTQVQKRIQEACGKVAREVRASLGDKGEYKYEIHVGNAADIDVVLNRLFGIADLVEYISNGNVSFFVDGPPGKS